MADGSELLMETGRQNALLAASANPAEQKAGPAARIPFGALPYKQLRTDPALGLSGSRPFGPGEYMLNHDGSWSSEMSATVQLPDGKWSVVPGLWLDNGKPTHVDEDEAGRRAVDFEKRSGNRFPRFPDEDTAESFANTRENQFQTMQPGTRYQPLYSQGAR